MTHEEIIAALQSLAPKTEWTLSGNDYSELNWLSDGVPPTLEEIEAEVRLLPTKQKDAETELKKNKAALLTKLGITADEATLLLS